MKKVKWFAEETCLFCIVRMLDEVSKFHFVSRRLSTHGVLQKIWLVYKIGLYNSVKQQIRFNIIWTVLMYQSSLNVLYFIARKGSKLLLK